MANFAWRQIYRLACALKFNQCSEQKNIYLFASVYYRPISLLSIFNKRSQKLVYKFGFRENYSTMHATLLLTDKLQRAIKDGQFSSGIFLDFSEDLILEITAG